MFEIYYLETDRCVLGALEAWSGGGKLVDTTGSGYLRSLIKKYQLEGVLWNSFSRDVAAGDKAVEILILTQQSPERPR